MGRLQQSVSSFRVYQHQESSASRLTGARRALNLEPIQVAITPFSARNTAMRCPVRAALAWLALCLLVSCLSAFPSAGPSMIRDKVPPPLRHPALERILTADRVLV